jgi:hypothetical protein
MKERFMPLADWPKHCDSGRNWSCRGPGCVVRVQSREFLVFLRACVPLPGNRRSRFDRARRVMAVVLSANALWLNR